MTNIFTTTNLGPAQKIDSEHQYYHISYHIICHVHYHIILYCIQYHTVFYYPMIIKVTYHPLEGHPPTLGWSPTNLRMCITDMEFDTYTLLTQLTPGDNCHGWWPSILRMVAHQTKDGHPPTLGWSPARKKCTTDLEFGTYTLQAKLTPDYYCHGWSPTIPQRVTRQPKDVRPPEGSELQTWNLTLTLYSQN